MEAYDRFKSPPDEGLPICCRDCDVDICPDPCEKLLKLINEQDTLILEQEKRMGYPEQESN